jgi:hypothetical protein
VVDVAVALNLALGALRQQLVEVVDSVHPALARPRRGQLLGHTAVHALVHLVGGAHAEHWRRDKFQIINSSIFSNFILPLIDS